MAKLVGTIVITALSIYGLAQFVRHYVVVPKTAD